MEMKDVSISTKACDLPLALDFLCILMADAGIPGSAMPQTDLFMEISWKGLKPQVLVTYSNLKPNQNG